MILGCEVPEQTGPSEYRSPMQIAAAGTYAICVHLPESTEPFTIPLDRQMSGPAGAIRGDACSRPTEPEG